jgi:hypothetical protein
MPNLTLKPWAIFKLLMLSHLATFSHSLIAEVDYQRDIKPLLKSRCYACHGSLKQKAGLRLDTAEFMRRGGDNGNVISLMDPLVLTRISTEDVSERMPPEAEGSPFTADEISKIKLWIEDGAKAPHDEKPEPGVKEHWAYQKLKRPELPKAQFGYQVNNPIDLFLARDYKAKELKPNQAVERLILLRRLYFDLTGLPPDQDAINRVEAAPGKSWYSDEVERLLNSPQHGERWARHWMDIWRYSDWWGLGDQHRNSQKFIWHWRDWIVEALNTDRPYDDMIRMMIAADELKPNDLKELRATGFLARNYFLFNRNQWMDETVEHVGKSFLGLTMNCAKCHDHKYDPIRQSDYYAMRAVFEPYMVRNEILPGQINDQADALPRAYDARMNEPTYLFIRGSETTPDKSLVIAPGVPRFISGKDLEVKQLILPAEAAHPGLRPHVIKSLKAFHSEKVKSSRIMLETATSQWRTANDLVNEALKDKQEKPDNTKALKLQRDAIRSLLARVLAEKKLNLAEQELVSLELRSLADQALNSKLAGHAEIVKNAVESEGRVAIAQAEMKLADSELNLFNAKPEKLEELKKIRDKADSELKSAFKKLADSSGGHTPLKGAEHIHTRFLNSTVDDHFGGFPETSSGRRTALAHWITDPDNPLPARVAVNHVWTRHFGQPLVDSVFDFGRNGSKPVNRELLDWLASELLEKGWSMKHMHRLIVNSAAYQMSSSKYGHENEMQKDPDNLYFWRWPSNRLESESVRDALLKLSGTLDSAMGGPPVESPTQSGSLRRSLYFFHSNNDRNAFLTTFDEATVKECYRRDQSIVPQQALALSNAKIVFDVSPKIVTQIESKLTDSQSDADFVRSAFRLVLGFSPSVAEEKAALATLSQWNDQAKKTGSGGQSPRAMLVWVLINHNDFVTLR